MRCTSILSCKAVAAAITLRYLKFYRRSAAHEEVTWSTHIGTATWRPLSQLPIYYLFIKSLFQDFFFFFFF